MRSRVKRRGFLASSAASAGLLALGTNVIPARAAAASLPLWVSNLPLWQWYAIPNTPLSSVEPTVTPLGGTGPSSKIVAWCGASLKREGSVYMLGAAGGHSDYAGNEVNALALNQATPRWVQLRAPTSNTHIVKDTQFYLDLKPSAAHTYYATQFINATNRMVVFASQGIFGGSFPSAPANFPYVGKNRSFSYNVASGDWDGPDHIAVFPGSGDDTACLCVKHPWTDDVYLSRNGGSGWYRWTRSSNTWVKLSNESGGGYAGAAIDPTRNRMLIVGGYSASAPQVRNLDGSPVSASFGGLGASALAVSGYPGVIFDEALDRYLVVYNSGGSIAVLQVHPESWVVERPSFSGTAPAARPNGIQNSVQYVPELGGFVIANSYGGNVYFVRTTA